MRIVFLFVSLVFVLNSCTGHKTTEIPAATDEIDFGEARDFVYDYDLAWSKRDTNALKQLMTGDYIYYTSTGSLLNRGAIIGWFNPADKYKVENAIRSDIVVKVYGATAIVSSRWKGNGSFGAEKFNDDQRCGFVLQKKEGKVRIIAEHCTQIIQ